jgi:hypothetical protein
VKVNYQVEVDADQVRSFIGISAGQKPKRKEITLYISHILSLGVEQFEREEVKNVRNLQD